jgi:hypothetical protein
MEHEWLASITHLNIKASSIFQTAAVYEVGRLRKFFRYTGKKLELMRRKFL